MKKNYIVNVGYWKEGERTQNLENRITKFYFDKSFDEIQKALEKEFDKKFFILDLWSE